jgi:hypothetical protein
MEYDATPAVARKSAMCFVEMLLMFCLLLNEEERTVFGLGLVNADADKDRVKCLACCWI